MRGDQTAIVICDLSLKFGGPAFSEMISEAVLTVLHRACAEFAVSFGSVHSLALHRKKCVSGNRSTQSNIWLIPVAANTLPRLHHKKAPMIA